MKKVNLSFSASIVIESGTWRLEFILEDIQHHRRLIRNGPGLVLGGFAFGPALSLGMKSHRIELVFNGLAVFSPALTPG